MILSALEKYDRDHNLVESTLYDTAIASLVVDETEDEMVG